MKHLARLLHVHLSFVAIALVVAHLTEEPLEHSVLLSQAHVEFVLGGPQLALGAREHVDLELCEIEVAGRVSRRRCEAQQIELEAPPEHGAVDAKAGGAKGARRLLQSAPHESNRLMRHVLQQLPILFQNMATVCH